MYSFVSEITQYVLTFVSLTLFPIQQTTLKHEDHDGTIDRSPELCNDISNAKHMTKSQTAKINKRAMMALESLT